MRDQLTIGCDAVQGGGKPDAAAPKDYARWGGELGIEMARKCLYWPRAARRAAFTKVLTVVKGHARQWRAEGAGKYETDLYVSTFERAFSAQMADPTAIIQLEIIS